MAWDSELSFEQEIRLEGFLRESGGKFLEVVSGYGVFSGILLAEYDNIAWSKYNGTGFPGRFELVMSIIKGHGT